MSLKSLEKAIPALLEHQESVDFSLLARGGCLPRAELVPAWPHMPGAVNGDAELLQVPLAAGSGSAKPSLWVDWR